MVIFRVSLLLLLGNIVIFANCHKNFSYKNRHLVVYNNSKEIVKKITLPSAVKKIICFKDRVIVATDVFIYLVSSNGDLIKKFPIAPSLHFFWANKNSLIYIH